MAPVPRWHGRRWPFESAFPGSRDPDRRCLHGHLWRCWWTKLRGLRYKGPRVPSASGKLYRRVRYSSEPPGGSCCLGTGCHLRIPNQREDQNVQHKKNKIILFVVVFQWIKCWWVGFSTSHEYYNHKQTNSIHKVCCLCHHAARLLLIISIVH